jgi:hypothetical protein
VIFLEEFANLAFGDSAEKNIKFEFMYLLIDFFDIPIGKYQGGSTTDQIFTLKKKMTRMTLADTQNKISVKNFGRNIGVRQGEPLSKMLFNIVLETVFRDSEIQTQGIIYHRNNK